MAASGGKSVSERQRSRGEEGGLQARANLNGGELDKEPFLRVERGQKDVTWM